jgi:uncharacterized protein with PQ loop repeat
MPATIAVLAATVLATVGLLPQVAKLIRTRVPDGVSITWAGFGVVTNTAWAVYLISQELWLAVPSVVMVVAGYAATFLVLARLGTPWNRAVALGAGWAVVLVGTGLATGWAGLGTLLGFSYIVQVAPGLWVAYRTPQPKGISPATWTIALVEGLLWGYYGWWHGDVPLMIFAVVATAASTAMLARYAFTRRRLPVEVAVASS